MINTADDLRKNYIAAKRGDLTSYAGMIGDEFSTKINRLAQIIGTVHELSVGQYKESLLRSCIESFIPRRYSVGTGFIVFTGKDRSHKFSDDTNVDLMNLKEHSISHQLDVVVFDDSNFPPLFRDKEFVILRPESVRTIIEVKGFLKKSLITESIIQFIRFGRKWEEYRKKYDGYQEIFGRDKLHTPGLNLMAWDVFVNKNGVAECDGGALRKTIVSTYRKNLSETELKDRSIPLLNGAYIYNDCCVHACGYASDKNLSGGGYSTGRGKFVRYDDDGKPFLDRDATVSNLLAAIHLNLETPFNPDFLYFDQSMKMSVFPHPYQGITDLVTGKEVNL